MIVKMTMPAIMMVEITIQTMRSRFLRFMIFLW